MSRATVWDYSSLLRIAWNCQGIKLWYRAPGQYRAIIHALRIHFTLSTSEFIAVWIIWLKEPTHDKRHINNIFFWKWCSPYGVHQAPSTRQEVLAEHSMCALDGIMQNDLKAGLSISNLHTCLLDTKWMGCSTFLRDTFIAVLNSTFYIALNGE